MPQDARRRLLGRQQETAFLDGLLRDVREGRSRALVLRGEAGIGKSALLDYLATESTVSTGMRAVRATGVEAESDFAYSALLRLIAPLLEHIDRLPPVHQEALRIAFGSTAGSPPDTLLVGLATLGLFSEAAAESPLVCLVDDAQWLDPMSHRVLTFVARLLDVESVALVFAERTADDTESAEDIEDIDGLPEFRIGGLADADARSLLDATLPGPVENRVRDRITYFSASPRRSPLRACYSRHLPPLPGG